MPIPNKGESKTDWISRCMGDPEAAKTFPDEKQRAAVCYSKWEEHQKGQGNVSDKKWLRASISGAPDGVDRQARVIRGYVAAQEGPFKSQGRGQFDKSALATIVRLGNSNSQGIKSRLGHPTMSDDGIGKFLGRAKNFRMGTAADLRTGKKVPAVRGDLYLDPSASSTPHGDLAKYVMDLAESDPGALSSSLVLEADEADQLDAKGRPMLDAAGEPLPPLWTPTRLHASDLVDTGDAVDALLSPEQFAKSLSVGLTDDIRHLLRFDNVARLATQLLDGFFDGKSPDFVKDRCQAWLGRYLENRFGLAVAPTMDCPNCGMGLNCPDCGWKSGMPMTGADMPPNEMPMPMNKGIGQAREVKLAELALYIKKLGPGLSHDNSTSANEPPWASVDKTKLPRVAFAGKGEADMKSSWSFPHHFISGGTVDPKTGVYTSGTMYLHKAGLNAAWAAAQGARSGQKASPEVIAHLQAHRRALGLE